MPEPIELPVRAEPKFERIRYAALPPETQMSVRMDTEQLIDTLKAKFSSKIIAGRSGFAIQDEELIISNGKPYRRVWVFHEDSATWDMHGACSQSIYVWFSPSGELANVFVENVACPI